LLCRAKGQISGLADLAGEGLDAVTAVVRAVGAQADIHSTDVTSENAVKGMVAQSSIVLAGWTSRSITPECTTSVRTFTDFGKNSGQFITSAWKGMILLSET